MAHDNDFVYDFDEVSYEKNKHARSQHWTDPEDEILKQLVAEHGAFNWPFIASLMNNREAKQCRERWLYHLSPEIKKGKLSEKEWIKVQHLQKTLGNRWSEIAKHVPGRSPNQIKNHWHSHNRNETGTTRRRSKPAKELKRKHEDAFEDLNDNAASTDSNVSEARDVKRFRAADEVEHEGTDTDDAHSFAPAPINEKKEVAPTSFFTLLAAIEAEESDAPHSQQPVLPAFTSFQAFPATFSQRIPFSATSSGANTPMASPVLTYEMQPPFPMMPMHHLAPFASFAAY